MLDYGVDPNLANDDGLTALHQVSLNVIDGFSVLEYQMLLLYYGDTSGFYIWQLFFKLLYVCLGSLSKRLMFVLPFSQIAL